MVITLVFDNMPEHTIVRNHGLGWAVCEGPNLILFD
jgi:hypothetical protein